MMAKFMVLYRAYRSAMEQMASSTPEQAKTGRMPGWHGPSKVGEAIVDLGAPLGDRSPSARESSACPAAWTDTQSRGGLD
jgi:hypothetical protein